MSRPRVPDEIKQATGKMGRTGINPRSAKAKAGIGRAPVWMSDAQREIWQYAVDHAPAGVLTAADRAAFTVWVVACEAHQQAALRVAEDGAIITTALGNLVQHPSVGMLNRQALIILRASRELGFTPASRSLVTTDGDGEEAADPAAEFFH